MNVEEVEAARARTNKALVREFYDVVENEGRLDALGRFLTADFVDQDHNGVVGARAGRDGFRNYLGALRKALPDLKTTVESIAADGDRVMVRKLQEATLRGRFAGFAPTGRRVRLESMDIFQIALGRIANYWHLYDGAVLGRQLQRPGEPMVQAAPLESRDVMPQRDALVRERNKAVVRYMHEGIDRQNWMVIDEVLAPDFVDHGATDVPPTAAGIKLMYERVYRGLPDAYTVIHDILAESDDVVVRRTCYCTHQGEMWGVAPTGRRVSVGLVNWFRLRDGRITEHWHAFDSIGLRHQLLGEVGVQHV